jgi:hypothetical protein
MILDKLAAIAEIVSTIAIVATLAYLGVQTRQTYRALLASSRAATMTADVAFLTASFSGADVLELLNAPSEKLNQVDRDRMYGWLSAIVRIREFAWFQYRSGMMDERALRSYLKPLVSLHQRPNVATAWATIVERVDPDFAAYMDALRGE